MTQYQKAATLVVRIIGVLITLAGLAGPLYKLVLEISGQPVPARVNERWAASVTWVIGGVVLTLLSKVLGKRLGQGLE